MTAVNEGPPLTFPSLLGLYLSVNALRDVFVLVDGPDCALYKAHFIHGRHDWGSTLLDVSGRHRVAFTNVCAQGVVREHDAVLRRGVKRVLESPGCGALLVTALPMCSITGVDYGRLLRGLGGLPRPCADVPPGSLAGDWLDGYAQGLAALARALPLEPGARRPGTVAVIGGLRDRNEADARGNDLELVRLVRGLGLEPLCVWPDGGDAAGLSRAREAEWIVSLPYGRQAARIVAERTGAGLIEADVPFGLPKTAAFLRVIGAAAGREAEAEAFIDAELRRVIPRLEWVLPHSFVGRSAAFIGDPHLLDGFLDVAEDTGLDVRGAVATSRPGHRPPRPGVPILHEPREGSAAVRDLCASPDVVVSCTTSVMGGDELAPRVEFGFPSMGAHALLDRPTLGFDGFLWFVERLAERLSEPRRRRRHD